MEPDSLLPWSQLCSWFVAHVPQGLRVELRTDLGSTRNPFFSPALANHKALQELPRSFRFAVLLCFRALKTTQTSGGFSLFCLKLLWFPNSEKLRVLQEPARSALSALSCPVSPVLASLFLPQQQSLCTAFCTLSRFSGLVALKCSSPGMYMTLPQTNLIILSKMYWIFSFPMQLST